MGSELFYKKCPHCGKMSVWNKKVSENCEFCLMAIAPAPKTEQAEKIFEAPVFSRWAFTILKPGEPFFLFIFKNFAFGIQILLTSILSFFIWLIAAVSG